MENCLRRAAWNVLEVLECRRLLASISGTILEDLNGNGSRDGRETGQAGVTVFLDQNRNRQFDFGESFTTTDGVGRYQFDNLAPGQYFVAQLPKPDFSQTYPRKGGLGNFGGDFHIQLEFARNVSPAIRSVAESAAAQWEKVLIGDLPAAFDEDYGEIDDIVIEVFAENVDGRGGTLAFAGPDFFREPDAEVGRNLPYRSSTTIDTGDAKDVALYETVVHELGHALGFTLFTWFKFSDPVAGTSLVAGTFGQPEFRGANAIREYNGIFGTDALGVPLEDYGAGQGSSFSHFSETVFGNELMSPFAGTPGLGEPMSRVTVGLMQDIGYTVDYRGADFYDPAIQDLPVTQPETAGGGLVDFSHTVTIEDADEDFGGKDFMSRINRRPTLDALKPENKFAGVGDIVKLRALGPADIDSGDSVTAVQFYLENNNIDGLQLGDGGDLYIGADESAAGGFRFSVRTGALGEPGNTMALGAGTHTFYSRPLDELLAAGKTRTTSVELFDSDSAPNKPTAITASARSSSSTFVSWNDRSNNEFGFRVERSRDSFFRSGVQRFTFDANVTSFVDTGLDAASEYFYRVRSFNVGGKSSFAGPASTITLAPHEVIVDDNDSSATSSDGVVVANSGDARGGTYTALFNTDAVIRFAPQLTRTGRYYVYAAWEQPVLVDAEQGPGVFSVTDIEGETRNITIDQASRGRQNSEVLLGQFEFKKGNRTVVRLSSGDPSKYATIDQLRFVPIG